MVKENRNILVAPRQSSNDGSSTWGSPRLFWVWMARAQIRRPGSFSIVCAPLSSRLPAGIMLLAAPSQPSLYRLVPGLLYFVWGLL